MESGLGEIRGEPAARVEVPSGLEATCLGRREGNDAPISPDKPPPPNHLTCS